MKQSVSNEYFQSAFKTCQLEGVDGEKILKTINLDQERLLDPTTRIPCDDFLKMLHFSEAELGKGGIGVCVGRNFRPNTFREVGYAAMMSKNIVEALNLNQRYQPLTQQIGVTHIALEGELARIVWQPHSDDDEYLRPMTDAVFGGYFTVGIWMAWIDVKTVSTALKLRHKSVEYADQFLEAFDCEVFFECERNELVFPRAVAEATFPQYNKSFVDIICRRLDRMIAKLNNEQENFPERVYELIEVLLPRGEYNLQNIASILGTSERTLRRHLSEYDVKYQDLLEQVRRESCEIHLRDPNVKLSDLAFRLGYSDQSAFNRAFRQWYEDTPVKLRESLMN